MSAIPYLKELSENAVAYGRAAEIAETIERHGSWEVIEEWRIATTMESRVEPVENNGKRWYRVFVKCDHEFVCHTPSIERAAEFVGIYQRLARDLFWTLGWASAPARADL